MVGVSEGKICPSLPIFMKILQTRSKEGIGYRGKKMQKKEYSWPGVHFKEYGIEPARKLRVTAESCACSANEMFSYKR